ncbi:hypothetical protein N7540_002260 [Penicillium herquei]|nr:hypothetical protein N7540_002260 [Penicillium herquei]
MADLKLESLEKKRKRTVTLVHVDTCIDTTRVHLILASLTVAMYIDPDVQATLAQTIRED